MTDRELYEWARRAYGPVLALRVWAALLYNDAAAHHLRRSLTREAQGG